jgi:hypothetical protein
MLDITSAHSWTGTDSTAVPVIRNPFLDHQVRVDQALPARKASTVL